MNLKVVANTIDIKGTVLTFTLSNGQINASARLEYFDDGIMNFSIKNPSNESEFNFYDVEPRPVLSPLNIHIIKQTKNQLELCFSNSSDYETSSSKSKYKVIINLEPFSLQLLTAQGKVLSELNPNNRLHLGEAGLAMDVRFPNHHLFGFAERNSQAYLKDNSKEAVKNPIKLSNRDRPGYPPFSPVGIYGSVPLLINISDNNTRALASVFCANPAEAYLELDKSSETHTDAYWVHEAGDLEMYFIGSDSPQDYFYKWARVSGFAYMPPIWALGFHQARFSYMTQEEVIGVSENLKNFKIPCDCIHLDIDWTDGYKYFTWHPSTYPDPDELIRRLRANKRKLVAIHDPHFKRDESYEPYVQAKQKGILVRDPSGKTFEERCWPGQSVWLDFTNPEAEEFWASLYHYENFPHSTRHVHSWNDMNEPAIFDDLREKSMSGDNLQTFFKNGERRTVPFKYTRNIYGHLETRGSFKGLIQRDHPEKYRPFILSRSYFAGTQKYGAIWHGDSGSKWPDLASQLPYTVNNSICGAAFCGGDVGGFFGNPSNECALRWFQIGAFLPFFRAHSDLNSKRREPYVYGYGYQKPIVESIYDRYRWLYYWYTLFDNHVRTGSPLIRPLWADTNAKSVLTTSMIQCEEQFFVGEHVLIVPVLQKWIRYVTIQRDLCGEEWFSRETGHVEKPEEPYRVDLERIGIFIRGGAIIPFVDLPE